MSLATLFMIFKPSNKKYAKDYLTILRHIHLLKRKKYKCWRKKFARVRKQQYIVQITEQRAILKHDFWNMILISKPQDYKTSLQIHPWLCFMTPSPSLSGFPYLQIKKRSKVLWKLQQQKNEWDKFKIQHTVAEGYLEIVFGLVNVNPVFNQLEDS